MQIDAEIERRIWSLNDHINEVRERAAIEGREITPSEHRQIERWVVEMKRLGGND